MSLVSVRYAACVGSRHSEIAERPVQHWVIHREFCKSDTTNDFTDIIADDGNPDWVDIDDFNIHIDEKPPWKREWPLFSDYEGLEIFIDIRNDSPFRKGEIVRFKTRTLSPECLKAYHSVWAPVRNSAKSKMRKHIEKCERRIFASRWDADRGARV